MSEEKPTPGQAAYEARLRSRAARLGHAYDIGQFRPTWDRMGDADRADEEAGAQAAIDAHGGTPVYLAAIATLSAGLRAVLDATMDGTPAHGIARKALADADNPRPQAAPDLATAREASDLEVAAIIAERNQLRMALQRLADSGNPEAAGRLAAIRPELTRAAPGTAPGQPADPFGGHEFHYEQHTDLFRCIKCHRYEVTVRNEDTATGLQPCTGQPPAGSEPIEVNAW